jgi:hypothetical protein
MAVAVAGLLFVCAIAGLWAWQAGFPQHAASQQGERELPQNSALATAAR